MRRLITITLTLTLLVAPSTQIQTMADGPTPIQEAKTEPVELKNVELTEDGVLEGQYLNEAGQPVVEAQITLTINEVEHKVVTNSEGNFTVKALTGGRVVIQAGKEVFACQIWSYGTAPPKSIKSIAMVTENAELVRGNYPIDCARPGARVIDSVHYMNPGRLAALSGKQLLALGLVAGLTVAIAVEANDNDNASL
jgi:hypothetical protein